MTERPQPAGRARRLSTLLGRVGGAFRSRHPMAELVSIAAEREIRWPAYLIAQTYAAWQAARVPEWRGDRFALRLRPGEIGAGWSALWRSVLPGLRRPFHDVRPRQALLPHRPNVLHVIPGLLVGGSQKIVFDLIQELGHAYRMRILTGWLPHFGRYPGLELTVARSPRAIANLLREFRPDLIHLHYLGREPFTNAFLEALDLAPDCQAPILQNNNMPIPALAHPRVAHCVHVSAYAMERYPCPSCPNSVVYPGVDTRAWAPRPGRDPAHPFTVGMVYRLATEKLNLMSIEPFIRIAREAPQVRMLIVGEGPLLAPFVARARDAGVRAQFHFAGRARYADLPNLYDRMDLFLAPLHEESYGVVVPYALSKGIPVLAYPVGALPEILDDDRCFCADAEEMAERALALIRSPERARELGQALSARRAGFSLEPMMDAYRTLYASLPPGSVDPRPPRLAGP